MAFPRSSATSRAGHLRGKPAGSAPDAIVHLYGVHPPLALTTDEYAVPRCRWVEGFGDGNVAEALRREESSRRENSESFIHSMLPDFEIPDSLRGLQTVHSAPETIEKTNGPSLLQCHPTVFPKIVCLCTNDYLYMYSRAFSSELST